MKALRAVLLVFAAGYMVLCTVAVLLLGLVDALDWMDGSSGWAIVGFWLATIYVVVEIAARTERR